MGRAFEYRKAAKEKRWGNMSRVFPKLAKAIEKAVISVRRLRRHKLRHASLLRFILITYW